MASILFCGKSCRNENNYVILLNAILHNAILHNPSINNCMKAIASEYPQQITPTSQDFIAKYSLKTASGVQTAMKGLLEKGILSNNHGTKRPTDLLFMLWLKNY